MQKLGLLTAAAILATALGFLVPGPVLAQTPDTFTPAEEYVCDGVPDDLSYGICNAYCEAMDCDSESTKASGKACTALARKWDKNADYKLPCEADTSILLTQTVEKDETGSIEEYTPVTYSFTIANVGDVPLSNITLSDPDIADFLSACDTGLDAIDYSLAPGTDISCTSDAGLYADPADIGQGVVANTATATAVGIYSDKVHSSADATYTVMASTPTVTCPCFEPADLAAIDGKFPNGDLKAGFNCSGVTDPTRVQTEEWEFARFGSSDPHAINLNVTNNPNINPNTNLPTIQCNYRDNTGASTSKFFRVQDGTITPDEVAECFAQVVAHNTDAAICDGNRQP